VVEKNDLGNPRTQTLFLLIGIAAVTLIAVWAVPEFTDGGSPPGVEAELSKAFPTEPIEPPPQFSAPGDEAREKIRAYRLAGGMADEAFQEGARQLARGRGVDAYLLYFYAARQGHRAAALALGTQADPAYHDPTLGFAEQPDVTQAFKWYRKAAIEGDQTAQERLTSLQSRVEREASQGNEQAQRLALLWR
jgi:hypothetical protein